VRVVWPVVVTLAFVSRIDLLGLQHTRAPEQASASREQQEDRGRVDARMLGNKFNAAKW
jgi:hypothetical protein